MDASEQIKQALIPRRLDAATEKEWDDFIKALASRIKIMNDVDTPLNRWDDRIGAIYEQE